LDVWRRGVFDSTRPNIAANVEELDVPEGTGKLLVVTVPKGDTPPYGTADGLYKKRVGKNCMPLDPAAVARVRIATGAVDWSGEPVAGVATGDLDPLEIARARSILRSKSPESELLRLDDAAFLRGLEAVRGNRTSAIPLVICGNGVTTNAVAGRGAYLRSGSGRVIHWVVVGDDLVNPFPYTATKIPYRFSV